MRLFSADRRLPVERITPTLDTKHFSNSSPENPSTNLSEPAAWLYDALDGGSTWAGPHVNEVTALRSTAVYRCIALKSGVIASLPLKVYKATDKGRDEAVNHRLYPLLAHNPSDLMSGFIWKELIVATLMTKGNHYSVIEYDNAARVTGLLPIIGRVTPRRVKGRNRYTVTFADGGIEEYDQDDIIHIPGLGFDGLQGISPIQWAGRQAIGNSMATHEFIGRLHSNGMRPSGTVVMPKGINKDGVIRLRAEIDQLYSGNHNTARPLMLDNGGDFKPMQISLADAQTLDFLRYSVADIARLFGVPPHMIGETDKTSSWGTGVEQQTTGFKIYNLEPELSRIEGELNRKLFTWPYYCEFNRDAITAMDAAVQADVFAKGVLSAIYKPSEIRRFKNLPDAGPEADKLYIQGATVPLDMAGKVTTKAPAARTGK